MLDEQGPGRDGAPRPVHRVHIGWKVGEGELRATVRDDGPGVLRRTALDARRVGERLAALGGRLDVDAVPEGHHGDGHLAAGPAAARPRGSAGRPGGA
ncbi:hypothetical protein [Streptomyces sp. OE57]|uniref:hypothetical protein n=1 Tax=Streptomyces lacaronensis TaxID=3379885 RepID=UPI0039B78216